MLTLFIASALAAVTPACPSAEGSDRIDHDSAPDGTSHVLSADAATVCWWAVDDRGDARVVRRWGRGDRHPIAIEALPSGPVVLVMSDLRVFRANPDTGEARSVGLTVAGPPAFVLAHGTHDWVALSVERDEESSLVVVLDLDNERQLSSVALPTEGLSLSWRSQTDALWLGGPHDLQLTAAGLVANGQSR